MATSDGAYVPAELLVDSPDGMTAEKLEELGFDGVEHTVRIDDRYGYAHIEVTVRISTEQITHGSDLTIDFGEWTFETGDLDTVVEDLVNLEG